jgi:alginate O-acetyltransferase complex protein AlgJ
LAGIVLTVAVLLWAPRARPWFRSASQAQRVTLLTTSMVCVAPVVALLYGPEPLTQRVTENRRLTAFPSAIPGDMAALADTTIQTEQWLSDHFGWRSLLIRTKNELDYRIFGTSSRVYYGSDDVIYMRRWSDERFPDLDAVLRDPQRRGLLLQRMRDRVAMYRAAGIVPIVVIAPSKEVIYPEYLPWYVAPYDTMLLRAFIVDLRAAGVTVIDAEQLLLDAKPQQPLLFHKQDFHWNSLAAHLVADAVLAEVAQVIPAQRPWRVPYRVVTAPSPFADRDFAGLLLDRYDVPAGVDIALDLPVTGEWRNTVVMGNAMDIWENTDPQVAFPAINLQIVGDSFSIRFIGAGFETA